jgi:hypothetical protein
MEKRTEPRNRTFKAGTIEFHGGAIDCTLRNVSLTGAVLDVASPLGIPEEFTLRVSADGSRRLCRIVWRREKRIGVAFVQQL